MTKKPDDTLERSLVPEIRQQEEHLLADIEKARSEVAHLQAEAERAADARLAEVRKELPGLVKQIQEQGVTDLQTATQEELSRGQAEIVHLENTAKQNLPDAVKHALSLVLGSHRR